MAASEQVLGLVVSAKDEATATLTKVDRSLVGIGKSAQTASGQVAGFSNALTTGRSSVAKFASAGSQLALVASILGPEFEKALGPVGQFIKVAGNIGLIASTAAELIPLATSAIAASGAAASAAAVEYDALAVAETNARAASLGFVLGLAGVAAAGATAAVALEQYSEGQDRALASTRAAAREAEAHQTILALFPNLETAFAGATDTATASLFELNAASIASREGFNHLMTAVGQVDIGIIKLTGTQKTAADAAHEHNIRMVGEGGAALSAALSLNILAGATGGVTAQTNENIGALSAEAAALNHVAFAAAVAARNLAALGSAQSAANAANNARMRQLGEAPGAGVSGALQHGYIPAMPVDIPGVGNFVPPKGAKGAKGGGGKSAADIAAEAARETAAAWDQAKGAADKYFDSVHDRNEKAIDDAHKVANEKIKADQQASKEAIALARKEAKDTLKAALDGIRKELAARKAANAAPVTAAEQAQAQLEASRSLRDLNEALAAAQASGDVMAIRDATEALQSFQAHQSIDAMRTAQDAADAAAEAWAEEATKAAETIEAQRQADLDQRQKDEDAAYAKRQAAEDKRYKDAQTAEDARWVEQRKKIDDQIAATADSTKATVKNANATTLLYLTNALLAAAAAKDYAGQVKAQAELDDFKRSIATAPKRAAGGPVKRGGLYVVGEQGPEYFSADRDGTIYPGGAMGGGTMVTLHNTVNVSGAENPERWAARYVQEVARRLRREGIVA
jgi:hypothetical protein